MTLNPLSDTQWIDIYVINQIHGFCYESDFLECYELAQQLLLDPMLSWQTIKVVIREHLKHKYD